MRRWIHKAESAIMDTALRPNQVWLFERALYLWFGLQLVFIAPIRELVWGEGSVFNRPNWPLGAREALFYRLVYNRSEDELFLGIHLVAVLLALVGWGRWIPKALVYLTGFILYYAAWPMFNGGTMLALLYAAYAVLIRSRSTHPARVALSNLGVIACMVQLTFVYAVAALYKWFGTDWLSGDALFKAYHLPAYARHVVVDVLGDSWLLSGLTFFGLMYQTAFPLLVWWKRTKRWILWAGVLFHVGILITMRIPDFALAMLLGYTLFLSDKSALRTREALRAAGGRLRTATLGRFWKNEAHVQREV